MEELASNGVEIYRFPVDDETVAEMNLNMNVSPALQSVVQCKVHEFIKQTEFFGNTKVCPWLTIFFGGSLHFTDPL